MEFQDKSLRCVDCGDEFIWTAGEQLFFADKQFKNEPKRCKMCKAKRANRAADADGAGRAGDILDDKGLAEALLHPLGEDARQCIGRAARRERHDHRHRPRRIALCEGLRRKRHEAGKQRDCGKYSLHRRTLTCERRPEPIKA